MKIAIIHGQNHKGSTWQVAHMLAGKLGGENTEFFLPRDFGAFCAGCCRCFNDSETKCPHYAALAPIARAIGAADIVILASPVYVCHASGAMKALLDHFAYRWMAHRPERAMFRKQGVCLCTAAGAGVRSALQDMADSLFFWGSARVYRYGVALAAADWAGVGVQKKRAIERRTTRLAGKLLRRAGKARPGLRTRAVFSAMRVMHRKGSNPRDAAYWQSQGWTEGKRPWRDGE